jgi:hypothetical protein
MNKDKPQKKSQEIVYLEPKPLKTTEPTSLPKTGNIRIDKIGSLTLNVFVEPLKARYRKHYQNNKIHLVIDLILAAIVIILLAGVINLWLFSRAKQLNLIDFNVIATPSQLTNGQEAEFTIDYTNTTKETLTDVTLVLKKPSSLHQPEYNLPKFDLKTNTLVIGDLAANAHGQFKIKGFLLGDLNTKQEFLAVMNYKNKYGQSRQEFFRQNFELNNSILHAQLILPKRVIATSTFSTQLNLKNNSQINLTDLKIKINWPAGYILQDAELGIAPNNLWTIGNFEIGQESTYVFKGKQYIDSPQSITIGSDVYVNYDNTDYLLASAQNSVRVEFSKFKLGFANLENSQSITPGGQAAYTVSYKNDESYPVTNVELGLNVAGDYAAKTQIRLTKNDYPQLAKIEPGQEGSIDLKAEAKNTINFTGLNEAGYQIEVKSFASYDDPVENSRISSESSPIYTKVSSRLTLSSFGLFYTSQGDQIGVGAIPPAVGEYTSYWIILKIINTNNPIKDVKITAQLPPGIEFTEITNVTAGDQVIYNPNSRQFEWTINDVGQFAGIFTPAPEARIQIAITPTINQINTSPTLLSNIIATATDTVTGTFLSANGKNVSTAIFEDASLNKVID